MKTRTLQITQKNHFSGNSRSFQKLGNADKKLESCFEPVYDRIQR
jgi:hypothetical protein